MNPLDDLISSSAGIPEATPEGLSKGRAELDSAIAASARLASPARRKAVNRWFGGVRGKALTGVAGLAAVAAAVTVIVLPSSAQHPAQSPLAGSSGNPTVKAPAQAGPATGTPLTYSVTPIKASLTSSFVLAEAAKGARTAGYTPQGNVPLINGWPNALYWHTVTKSTGTGCPDQVTTSDVWLGKGGSEMVTNKTTGSPVAVDHAQCNGGPTANSTYPVGNVPPGPFIGGQQYTWAEFAALPTDPAALWPILQTDSTVGVAPYKGVPEQDWLYATIMMTLEQDPVAPKMRVALLADAEKISGVTVTGKYTDSLGRTGIALHLNAPASTGMASTTVIDTSNGQVLAAIVPTPAHQGCTTTKFSGGGTSTECSFGSAQLFISANATNTEPSTNQPAPSLETGPAPSKAASKAEATAAPTPAATAPAAAGPTSAATRAPVPAPSATAAPKATAGS